MGSACQQHAMVKKDITLNTIPTKNNNILPSFLTFTDSHARQLNLLQLNGFAV
jgi:hypothetical protein